MTVEPSLSSQDRDSFRDAVNHFSAGRYTRAAELASALCRRHDALQVAHKLLGSALHLAGRSEDAVAPLRRATSLAPDDAQAWSNLGNALAAIRQYEKAVVAHGQAVTLQPNNPTFRYNLGCVFLDMKRPADALEQFWKAYEAGPADPEVAGLCRGILRDLGDPALSETFCRMNVMRAPDDHGARSMLGGLLVQRGEYMEGEGLLRSSLQYDSENAVGWSNLCVALIGEGRLAEAIEAGRRAVALVPDWALAHNNLGAALRDAGEWAEARQQFMEALALDGECADAWYNLGCISVDLAEPEDARSAFIEAVKLAPLPAWVLQGAHACRQMADWEAAEVLEAELERQIASGALSQKNGHCPSPFAFLATPGSTAAEQLQVARNFSVQFAGRNRLASSPNQPVDRLAKRPLRVGLLSADFRDHATAHLITGVLEALDPARFYLIAYDYSPPVGDGDEYRRRLQAAIPKWVDVRPMSDIEAATRMLADAVDIVIDLKGWTQGYRAGILAHRPAPVQMQWLGFPGTMGAAWIDYIIADAVVIPPGMEDDYSEKVLRLPVCYQPNDRLRAIGPTPDRASLGLPENAVVLAGFHQYYKITRGTFALWMRVLGQCPDAVLWLLDGPDSAKEVLLREAAAAGIEHMRLVWAPRVPAAEHLGRLGQADLALDAFPVNAHTTASDSLWAGVPQLAICGNTFVSRVSASILHSAGLSQLVANDEATYERLIVELIRNVKMREMLRNQQRKTRDKVALFDAEAFARNLCAGLEEAWQRHQRGLPVAHIDVTG